MSENRRDMDDLYLLTDKEGTTTVGKVLREAKKWPDGSITHKAHETKVFASRPISSRMSLFGEDEYIDDLNRMCEIFWKIIDKQRQEKKDHKYKWGKVIVSAIVAIGVAFIGVPAYFNFERGELKNNVKIKTEQIKNLKSTINFYKEGAPGIEGVKSPTRVIPAKNKINK